LAALALLGLLFPASATPVAAAGPTVPGGFQDRLVWSGLSNPTAVVFAPDGSRVFVAEKNGRIKAYDGLTDSTATTVDDLSADVYNYWDRGLLGLAIDPKFTTGRPYLYALYTYNHILGNGNDVPAWGSTGLNDTCPNPPGGNTDGCVVSGRLDRITLDTSTLAVTDTKHLITDWCQQFPSHSIGSLAFGPEGALYVSGGDGASFNEADYGQLGGSLANSPTGVNPCGDPTDEGGALRSQDLRTSGDPTTLDGAILRIDPDTGAAWPSNANAGSGDANKARIIAEGLRNPFRMTVRSDGSVWVGDVGYNTWEEINKIPDPNASPRNFGWPCYEGNAQQPEYAAHDLPICTGLGSQNGPAYTYNHGSEVVPGDGCQSPAGSAIAGLAFHGTAGAYPSHYNGLFFTDWARACIWFVPLGGNGDPDFSRIEIFDNLHPSDTTKGGAVYLGITPAGDLIYTNLNAGEVHVVTYGNDPVAVFTANPTSGLGPLTVKFNASGSADPNGQTLSYSWDLDGNGTYGDSTSKTPSKTYTASGSVSVGLQVKDPDGNTDTVHHTITIGSTPPVPHIDTPSSSLTWAVGDEISFSGHATDAQDGDLPDSAFHWTLKIEHCPSSCHEHTVTSWDGVSSGSFDAPNHGYPSWLRLILTVTDSSGLSTTTSRDIHPKTGTVDTVSDPVGISVSPSSAIGIVGSTVDVSAVASAVLGEETWTFDHWSDGGARVHSASISEGATHLTASYAFQSSADAPSSCASAAIASTGLAWRPGRLASGTDVDWYRFNVTASRTYQVTLADLPADASLSLYKGCSSLLATSDRGGLGSEEIMRSLSPGTYALRVASKGGSSDSPYAIRFRGVATGLSVLSATSQDDGAGTLTLVGEVWNEFTSTRGPITVTAKLYDDSGNLLATRTGATIMYAVGHSAVPFRIVGSMPAGFDRVVYSVSAPTSSTVRSVHVTPGTFAEVSSRWKATGTIKATSGAVRSVRMALVLYDSRGTVIDVVKGSLGSTTLASNASTSYSAWSAIADLDINRARIRASAFRP
jgi:glucose/arabinose dehydrogenase/PKD repeat protein